MLTEAENFGLADRETRITELLSLLAELTLPEAKAIIKRGLGEEATDEMVAQVITITGGIHRQVDMIIPRILDLREKCHFNHSLAKRTNYG